ncbi:multidrug effflux MFS transporter [Chromobacterium phragmitis]|uniref:multidrug effflux MFS transporter n=1 Tax=Chromobacterium amazonense TaxID=1382803 RepID=UPI0021B7E44F|nr:multidrug effflux MFS transporter [Chromobacterium amazonense]MBM2883304.1 multidrug effflux MFS transporter [Chromobacterium amazonense]
MKKTLNHPFLMMLLIVALAPIGQMAIDIYVTALPEMRNAFQVSQQSIQLSVTAYLVSFACGQLFYGPIADAYGRKTALLAGLGLYMIGSLIILQTHEFSLFLAARVIQGLGIASASVVMKAIAPDNFSGQKLAHVMTYMVIGWGMGPIVAPVIGAQLQKHFGWESCLYFLFAYGALLCGLTVFGYKESLKTPVPLRPRVMLQNIGAIFRSKEFHLNFLTMGLCYGVLLTFNLCAPFMVQDVLHQSPVFFGNIALAMGLTYFAGVFSNRIIAGRIRAAVLCKTASIINLACAGVMLFLANRYGLTLLALIVPPLIITFFAGVIFPNLMARSVALFPQIAGLASSLLGFSFTICAGVIMYVSSLLRVDVLTPLATLYVGVTALSLVMIFNLYATRTQEIAQAIPEVH